MNPGKSSLEGATLTKYLCPEASSSTGKDDQVDTGFFYVLKLPSNKRKTAFPLMNKE